MAFTYASTPVLSKLKVGSTTYYLKDADARAIIDGFNADIVNGQLGTVDQDGKLVYSQNIRSYVTAAIAGVNQFSYTVVNSLPENPTADNMYIIYLVPKASPATGYKEYLCVDKGEEADPRYVFEEIGDTDIDLSNYYTKSEVNDLLDAKANTAELGDLAYKDEASAVLADYVTDVSASVTAAGSVELSATATAATLTKGDYTPEGTVAITGESGTVKVLDTNGNVTAGTAATFTEGAFTPNTPTVIDTTKFNGGNKASDSFTQGSFTQGSDSFTAASLENGFYTAGTAPTLTDATIGSFAQEGLVASVASEDSEMLVFSAASTANAVTNRGTFNAGSMASIDVTKFNGGSFTQGNDTFVKPTFTEGAFTPASLASGFYTAGKAASKAADTFDGGAPTTVTLPTFKDATVLTDATATFTGTKASNILVTGVSYDKATSATFTGTEVEASVTVTKDSKTITVR